MRSVALATIADQAKVCQVVMDGIKTELTKQTEKIDTLTHTVNSLVTEVAVLKQRWQIFAIIASAIGFIGLLIGIWGSLAV